MDDDAEYDEGAGDDDHEDLGELDDGDDDVHLIIAMRTNSISKASYIKGAYNCSYLDGHISDIHLNPLKKVLRVTIKIKRL